VDRLACVDVLTLPLQLLGRRHPDWIESGPVAVVDRDEPNGTIEWVDREARRSRIRPGMRYGEALSIRNDLRADTVEEASVDEAIDTLRDALRDFSPFVEAADDPPGLFWLDASGLGDVFDSLEAWAQAVVETLYERQELYASIAVGFTRFGTSAVARASRGIEIFSEPADERSAAREVSLDELGLDPSLLEELEKLGSATVGAFLRLPPTGVRRRFGEQIHRLHQRARGDLRLPLQAEFDDGPIEACIEFDDPVSVSTRLVFRVKRRLNPLLARLADRQRDVTRLRIELFTDADPLEPLEVEPATPTTDAERLLELVRLQLEGCDIERAVDRLELTVRTSRTRDEQLQLFEEAPRRDLEDANRALERLQAEFGSGAVVRAVPKEGHLPEAQFDWEPLDRLEEASPEQAPESPALVRRFWSSPRQLPADEAPGRQLALPTGRGIVLGGPYLVSGGWWVRETRRAYYFAERSDGALLWLYWDGRREEWHLQGRVE